MVSAKELVEKLSPLVIGYAWGQDAIIDLWKKGAPDPKHSFCKAIPKCNELECPHVKRVFFPGLFADWWRDVANRQGLDLNLLKANFNVKRHSSNGS